MTLTEEQIAEIRARAEAATPGPWAYESVSEKSNDYCIGIVCPVDKDGDPGDPIMGNVKHHPHYFNAETCDFGEWYYEVVCSIDESEHGGDGSLHADARFIAHARDDIPALLSALEAANKRADEAERTVEMFCAGAHGAAVVANASASEANHLIDQLNVLCEDFGCLAGTDRLHWLRDQLSERDTLKSEVERLREAAKGSTVIVNTASSEIRALKARADGAEALAERLKREAQHHAQEARTANATIAEIYREVSGGKGEPGNWNGAEPVRAELTALRARVAELEGAVMKLRAALKPFADVAEWDIGDSESDRDTFRPIDPRCSISGNISIGHLRRALEAVEESEWVADKILAQQTNDDALKGDSHEQG